MNDGQLNDARWSQTKRDRHRGTKTRSLCKTGNTVTKHVSLPPDVWARVENLQKQFQAEHGVGLSVSAAIASLIKNAPAYPTK